MPESTKPACVGCDFCGALRGLFAWVLGGWRCADCWRRVGRPFPGAPAPEDVVAELEAATRKRMASRGGSDLYRVRGGKT